MKKIDLALEMRTKGAVLSWAVYLENISPGFKVKNWGYDPEKQCSFAIFNGFPVHDQVLDVFIATGGKIGGSAECRVIINGTLREPKIISTTTDKNYAHAQYPL